MKKAVLLISGQFCSVATRGPHKAFILVELDQTAAPKIYRPHISVLTMKIKLLNNLSKTPLLHM